MQHRLLTVHPPLDVVARREVMHLVRAYVDNRKAAGWGIERVVAAVQDMARHADVPPSRLGAKDAHMTARAHMVDEMVKWSIDQYRR